MAPDPTASPMRTIKPLRLSLVHRTFENAGQPILAATAFLGFRLDSPKALQHEVALWKAVGQSMPDAALDDFMPKMRGEVVVAGNAHVIGDPQPASTVRVVLRREDPASSPLIDKELAVFGDRTWSSLGMSKPTPFSEMPVSWERAFGGEGFAENPKGIGFRAVTVDGKTVHAVPNIENRKKLIASASDKPTPAGLMPLDIAWPQRMKRVGTYDQKWLETRFPYYAEDLDWEFFNVAPEDQRIQGFFRGDERYRIEGMNSAHRVIEGTLPPARARIFVERKKEPGELKEIPLKIDTLVFFPNMMLGVMAFRGTMEVDEDDADDIKTMVGGVDDAAAPRDTAHYREIQRIREDKERAQFEMLNDKPVLPEWFVPPTGIEEGFDDMTKHLQLEFHGRKRAEARGKVLQDEHRARLVEAGMSKEEATERIPEGAPDYSGGGKVPKDLSELPEFLYESRKQMYEQKAALEKKLVEQEANMRASMAAKGRDFDAERAAAMKSGVGPPKVSLASRLESMRANVARARAHGLDMSEQEAQLGDPKFIAGIEELDRMRLRQYRTGGHLMPVAPDPLPPEASIAKVEEARAKHANKESLAGFDFTGVDLAGLDLSGADLSNALFESARLAGAKLVGVKLDGAMMGRSSLDGGDLRGASLKDVNLARSTLQGAILDGADLTRANFFESNLDGASMKDTRLERVTFLRTVFGKVDFGGAKWKMVVVLEADLAGARFAGLETDQVSLLKSSVEKVDFSGAKLTRTTFVECAGAELSFAGATLTRVAFVSECRFEKANFVGATLHNVCTRGTSMIESDFTEASARECDLSSTDLTRAKLYHLKAPETLFVRTNLTGADLRGAVLINCILQKAKIFGADFRGANLFRADLSKVRGDDATNFKDSYKERLVMAGSLSEKKARESHETESGGGR